MHTWILASLIACTPEAEPGPGAHPLAGCQRSEARTGEGEGAPWWRSETLWDERGRIVEHQRTITASGEPTVHEGFGWIYDGELLIEEISWFWTEPHEVAPTHQRHSYDAQGRRIQTEQWRGGDDPAAEDAVHLGVWTWELDAQGRPAGGTYDYDGDGEIDGTRQERWTKEAFGWKVESAEQLFGLDGLVVERELDEQERLLWMSEDWDADGGSDRIEQRVYVPDTPESHDLFAELEISGPSVVDVSCTYEHDGLDRIHSACSDELHEGWFETDYQFERPARVSSGTVWLHHDDGSDELWEHYAYSWQGCL